MNVLSPPSLSLPSRTTAWHIPPPRAAHPTDIPCLADMMASLEDPPSTPAAGPNTSVTSLILDRTLVLYPLALLFVFVFTAVARSIYNARNEEVKPDPDVLGPGGKPLPVTKKKRRNTEADSWGPQLSAGCKIACEWLCGIMCLAFLSNLIVHLVHTFIVWPDLRRGQDVWRETSEMSVCTPYTLPLPWLHAIVFCQN